jgi:basic membrane protein A
MFYTSMLKRVDVSVYDTIKALHQGQFQAGTIRFGLKNDGVGFSIDQYNKSLLSADHLKKVDQLKSQIVAGKIQVPDYYKSKEKK